jgi:hypothetical protein
MESIRKQSAGDCCRDEQRIAAEAIEKGRECGDRKLVGRVKNELKFSKRVNHSIELGSKWKADYDEKKEEKQ